MRSRLHAALCRSPAQAAHALLDTHEFLSDERVVQLLDKIYFAAHPRHSFLPGLASDLTGQVASFLAERDVTRWALTCNTTKSRFCDTTTTLRHQTLEADGCDEHTRPFWFLRSCSRMILSAAASHDAQTVAFLLPRMPRLRTIEDCVADMVLTAMPVGSRPLVFGRVQVPGDSAVEQVRAADAPLRARIRGVVTWGDWDASLLSQLVSLRTNTLSNWSVASLPVLQKLVLAGSVAELPVLPGTLRELTLEDANAWLRAVQTHGIQSLPALTALTLNLVHDQTCFDQFNLPHSLAHLELTLEQDDHMDHIGLDVTNLSRLETLTVDHICRAFGIHGRSPSLVRLQIDDLKMPIKEDVKQTIHWLTRLLRSLPRLVFFELNGIDSHLLSGPLVDEDQWRVWAKSSLFGTRPTLHWTLHVSPYLDSQYIPNLNRSSQMSAFNYEERLSSLCHLARTCKDELRRRSAQPEARAVST